jgi:hypothetical protein
MRARSSQILASDSSRQEEVKFTGRKSPAIPYGSLFPLVTL